ncbi:hypothetical protein A4G26_10800 [Mycobacterium kansasii]|nr:hypothetical protein A4G26_10800 [Mycobacterium kansasii]
MSISLPDGAAAQSAVELRTAAPLHAAIVINLAAPVHRDIPTPIGAVAEAVGQQRLRVHTACVTGLIGKRYRRPADHNGGSVKCPTGARATTARSPTGDAGLRG